MLADKRDLILKELEDGTGASIGTEIDRTGLRSGLRIWFSDLDERHGPIADLHPHGLKGHKVELSFGDYSGEVLRQIREASAEDVQLARALIDSINKGVEIEIPGQNLDSWSVTNGSFRMTAKIRDLERPVDDATIVATCRNVIVPMMAAMAELIGYDTIEESLGDDEPPYEGALRQSLVKRRERNPRNRLLCIRIHGDKCKVCGIEPRISYGAAGAIIEVHHIEPVASLAEPRPYDPRVDLVPLCPNCHRAVHTRRPVPFSIEELSSMIGHCRD